MKFEWDPVKERVNRKKHGVSFGEACYVFADRHMLTLYDYSHSHNEERWITMGLSPIGRLVVVIHTYRKQAGREVVRIISARKAGKREAKQYAERLIP